LLNENHENSKHQKPNTKQIPITKTQNSKQTQWSRDINELIGMFRLRAAQALAPRVGISVLDII
jgi:hypothetical protein